ncbi:DMXL1 [Bugula neritina]|uniref:DMXL1 n=1 Tax=Bugula neritina TaxID=10212 RepID=A0A7J7K208_BUGNE|nr:DMXL1 [Bugula neritina]
MSANVLTYSDNSPLEILQNSNGSVVESTSSNFSTNSSKATHGQFNLLPHVYMLSKHLNGSLNLWKANFSENSKFRACVSVSHSSRACGHRFRTNSAASHPVLPLLITTSHHNLPVKEDSNKLDELSTSSKQKGFDPATDLSSELILWRVDSIGPLSLAGGVTELAKVNSPDIAAFDNVAWLPTLLPSSALGSTCNSSSSLFVASDGSNMRLYQAVIDARGLLSADSAPKHHVMVILPYL